MTLPPPAPGLTRGLAPSPSNPLQEVPGQARDVTTQ